ncbi:hypothetical protein JF66_12625 [Cryobacterium sp. MLB-32]|nr:hypothetical protein JF66_12625 [Cryobacterium sp. MLB-32]
MRPLTSRPFRAAALAPVLFLVLTGATPVPTRGAWDWPTAPPHQIGAGFVAPLTPYSAGHRGIDVVAPEGTPVLAPADGVISFVGLVADRPVVSISQGGGVISALEPVQAEVNVGDRVVGGQRIGVTSSGGHCTNVCLHFGVRRYGMYVSPLNFLDGVQRAVLLPVP